MRDEVAHEIVGRKGRRRRFRLSSQDGPAPAPLGLSREAAAPARSRQSGKPPLLPTGAPRRPHGRPQQRAGLRPREPPFRAGRRTGGSRRANPRSRPERGSEGGGRRRVGLTLSARREGILQGACFLGDGRGKPPSSPLETEHPPRPHFRTRTAARVRRQQLRTPPRPGRRRRSERHTPSREPRRAAHPYRALSPVLGFMHNLSLMSRSPQTKSSGWPPEAASTPGAPCNSPASASWGPPQSRSSQALDHPKAKRKIKEYLSEEYYCAPTAHTGHTSGINETGNETQSRHFRCHRTCQLLPPDPRRVVPPVHISFQAKRASKCTARRRPPGASPCLLPFITGLRRGCHR